MVVYYRELFRFEHVYATLRCSDGTREQRIGHAWEHYDLDSACRELGWDREKLLWHMGLRPNGEIVTGKRSSAKELAHLMTRQKFRIEDDRLLDNLLSAYTV